MAGEKVLNKNFLIAAVLGLGIASGVAGYAFKEAGQERKESARSTEQDIITFNGFPEGTTATAQIEMGGNTTQVAVEAGRLVLNEDQVKNFRIPYVLSASFTYPDGTYRDFSWSMASNGAWYDFLADGFSSDDKVLLTTNDIPGVDMGFDWSGKFVFPLVLELVLDYELCFDITETAANRKLNLCQFKPGMKQG